MGVRLARYKVLMTRFSEGGGAAIRVHFQNRFEAVIYTSLLSYFKLTNLFKMLKG